ncbi:unnamed protein product [Alopecurus aequalis]
MSSGCLLDRRVRTDFDDYDEEDLVALLPFTILRCVEKKASGFLDQDAADKMVKSFQIGVHLANSSPGISCLGIRGVSPLTNIEAVDRNIVVFTTTFLDDFSRHLYVIYDSVKGSVHMIPAPENHSWIFTGLTVRILIARPSSHDSDDYVLVLAGKLEDVTGSGRHQDALLLWRPTTSSLPPWSKIKKARFPGETSPPGGSHVYQADIVFSWCGRGHWVDLLRGVSICELDPLFDKYNEDDLVVPFGFVHLPVKATDHRNNKHVPEPKAFRTLGVISDSYLQFISIDGFLEQVDLKDRNISIWNWKSEKGWVLDFNLRLETLWKTKGFEDLPKDMVPMYPLVSTDHPRIFYFALGEYEYSEDPIERTYIRPHYLVAANYWNFTIKVSSLADCFGSNSLDIISSDINSHLRTVGLDLHLMMMETMKQLSLNSLDPSDYDDEDAVKIMKEGPCSWQETNHEDWRNCGSPALLPASYYYGPSPYGPFES